MKDYPAWLTELMMPKKNLNTVMAGMMYNMPTEVRIPTFRKIFMSLAIETS